MNERIILLAAVAAAYCVVFLGIELLAKGTSASAETLRKIGHVAAGLMAAAFPLFLTFNEIAIAGVLLSTAAAAAINLNLFRSVRRVERTTYGEILFPLSITVVALLFPNQLLYTYAILVLALADAFASIIGVMYGHRKFSLFGSHKSYLGSVTFFTVAMATGVVLIMALTSTMYLGAFAASIVAAVVLTLVEAASSKGADNLTVPLVAASLLWLMQSGGFFG